MCCCIDVCPSYENGRDLPNTHQHNSFSGINPDLAQNGLIKRKMAYGRKRAQDKV